MRLPSALLAALLAPLPALADGPNAALILGNANYPTLGRLPSGSEVTEDLEGLRAMGFDISGLANGGAERTAEFVAEFLDDAAEAERLLVVLSGRFVTDGGRTWFLATDAATPTLFGLGDGAVSVESLMQVLARHPSRALLALGVSPEESDALDPWLREGVGDLDVPQGVTVLTSTPRGMAEFVEDELSVPRGDLARLVARDDAVRAQGYLPQGFAFMPAAVGAAPRPAVEPVPASGAEAALWAGAVALDTVEAYRDYLRAYPRGPHAAEAEGAVAAILSEPNRAARLAEEDLDLTRDERRAAQRALSLIGFDPRGVDGVFGPGTRSAITDWQQQNGFPQTSYLDAEQVARLEAQAARRAAEVEAEAERQRQAALAADRAYWEETGARGDEAGLRAYLARYPDGLSAEAAADRLALIEEERRQQAQGEERRAWDAAREADNVRAYQRYLDAYPEGRFVEEARARRAELAEQSGLADALAEARAEERALGLNELTARVVEERLAGLGLDPGAVDGRLDEESRRALRGYQRDRGLRATGFLDEDTLVLLLADSLGQALRD